MPCRTVGRGVLLYAIPAGYYVVNDTCNNHSPMGHRTPEQKALFEAGLKKCLKCSRVFKLESFYKRHTGYYGSYCRWCSVAVNRANRKPGPKGPASFPSSWWHPLDPGEC